MPRMRLYTRSGDDGSTGLFGGGRVDKDHPRVDAYGCVDELNACIGWALCAAQPPHLTTGLPPAPPASSQTSNAMKTGVPSSNSNSSVEQSIRAILTTLQSRLFDLGADLATPLDSRHQSKIQRITADHVAQAERWIDEIDAANAPITNFILPGGRWCGPGAGGPSARWFI